MMAVNGRAETDVAMCTPRLVLSALDPRYAAPLFELLNDWDVVRMLAEVPWPLGYVDVETFLRRDPVGTDAFVILGDVGPIGVASFKRPGSGEPPRTMPRLGYWIGRRHWGLGYGTEAVGALVDHAFKNDPGERIGAGVFHDNPASRRLLEGLGFSEVGRYLTYSTSRAAEVETTDMQLTRAKWAAARARRQ
jgi:RimJ/RimL family protein N-acetyltransferase